MNPIKSTVNYYNLNINDNEVLLYIQVIISLGGIIKMNGKHLRNQMDLEIIFGDLN